MIQIYRKVTDWEKNSAIYSEMAAKFSHLPIISPEMENHDTHEAHKKGSVQIFSQSSIGPHEPYAQKLFAYLSGRIFRLDLVFFLNFLQN